MFYNKQMTSLYTTAELLQRLMDKQREERENEKEDKNKNISIEDLKRRMNDTAYYSLIEREDDEEEEEKKIIINNKENKMQKMIFYIKIAICILSILLCILCIIYVIRQRRAKELGLSNESDNEIEDNSRTTCGRIQQQKPIIRTIYIKQPTITYEKQEINKVIEEPEIINKPEPETINKEVIEKEKIETKPQIEEINKDEIINKEDLIKLKELNKNISNMSATTNNNISTLKEISAKYGEINNKINEIEELYNKVVIIKPNEEKKEEEKENET